MWKNEFFARILIKFSVENIVDEPGGFSTYTQEKKL